MDFPLASIGVAKLLFGLLVGLVGIWAAARTVKRLSGFDSIDESLRSGNAAVGITLAGAIIAMGIMTRHAVTGSFSALDLLLNQDGNGSQVLWFFLYATLHVGAALLFGAAVLVLGIRAFFRLTPDVNEVEEIRSGNVASALVLAAMVIVLALLAQQGLETTLDALLPLPTLGRELIAPA